jgi:FAD-linked oxidoreductase
VMLLPDRLVGIRSLDRNAMTVTVLAGTPLRRLNEWLAHLGLALHNMGDVDVQTVGGAISTGTHGTGGTWASLSAQVQALELVTAEGAVATVSGSRDPELFEAARVGLGALGVITAVTLRVEPAFTLEAVERQLGWEETLERFDALLTENEHVDLYWFPHTDRVLAKCNNRTTAEPRPRSRLRRQVEDELLANTLFGLVNRVGNTVPASIPALNRVAARGQGARTYRDSSHRVFVAPRRVRFRETEYAVPREAGPAALRALRSLIERSGWRVGFPVEIRRAPADDVWLSPATGRDTVYLACHVNAGTDHRAYFAGVEAVLRDHDGRPHWGKLHTRCAADLEPAYPRWRDVLRVRDRVDPHRLFGNAYLERVLGE